MMSTVKATTAEWRRLAHDDPFFAVAARPEKYKAWTPDEFYELGSAVWPDYERQWLQYEPELAGACVEIGCGVGRVTQSLVKRFEKVIATDVSPQMIQLAQAAAPTAEFRIVEGTEIPIGARSVDAVFTVHVLQHLENQYAVEMYFRESLRVLRPGGTMMAHLLLAERPRPVVQRLWAELKLRVVRLLRANRRGYSRVCQYRPDQIRSSLEGVGFVDVELREFRVSATDGLHAFWLARAPRAAA